MRQKYLGLARDFRRTLAQQAERKWQRFFPQLLFGKTVGILGVGLIAEDLAPRLKALGMNVVGISRTARPAASAPCTGACAG